ncbi:MAG: tRNA lysidine(34) synthetase TilS [Lachnospiraceae bacterium]|nr:tRNA lysidine(34) synthetase TilS [Lachnospiraceae bacterium]
MKEQKAQLLKQIRQDDLIPYAARCLVALSGGCDSVSLLLLLQALRKEKDLTVWAVHINHGLRQSAKEDEAFCISLCQRFRIPLVIFREDAAAFAKKEGLSVEEAGRRLRYSRFLRTAEDFGLDTVLTAHQQDDQTETVLLNLFRGTGLAGLCGISATRELAPGIRLIRPLLSVPRKELESFLREEGIEWREDESNRDPSFRRNYIRQVLMPSIEEKFPGAAGRIAQTAEILRGTEGYLEDRIRDFMSRIDPKQDDILPLAILNSAEPALRPLLLQAFLRQNGGIRDITAEHYREALELADKQSGSGLSLPNGRFLMREQDVLRVVYEGGEVEEEMPSLSVRTFPFHTGMKIPNNVYTKWIDYAIMNDHVRLRRRADGDYFYLPEGGKKLLARYLVDNKIPLSRRETIWVLADGSHVLWVIGYRLSAAAYITEKTETVAEITVEFKGRSQ